MNGMVESVACRLKQFWVENEVPTVWNLRYLGMHLHKFKDKLRCTSLSAIAEKARLRGFCENGSANNASGVQYMLQSHSQNQAQ